MHPGTAILCSAKKPHSDNVVRIRPNIWDESEDFMYAYECIRQPKGCDSAPFNDLIDRGKRGTISEISKLYSKIMFLEVLGVLVAL